MFIRDVIEDASEVLGYCQESVLFSRLTDAIEVLANKGQWEPLQAFIDIRVESGRIVTLPEEIESPIKIKINGNPAFSRSRIFEFSMNALSDDMEPVGWAWEDRGLVSVNVHPVNPSKFKAIGNAADAGKRVRINGWTADGVRLEDTLILGAPANGFQSVYTYAKIDQVFKDVTQFPVDLQTDAGVGVSHYGAHETAPQYRQIRLTKDAAVIRMLYRRVTHRVTSLDDFIPLHSKMSLVLMLKALEAYRRSDPSGEALEAKAVAFITEEQATRDVAMVAAQASEVDTATGIVYKSNSIITVADIYDDASSVFGPVGRPKLMDRISDSIKLLSVKANWDSMQSYLDIKVQAGNRVVLPDDVEVPIAININGQPSFARDRMFEFTLNTPGSTMQDTAGYTWDDRGMTAIDIEIITPGLIGARGENAADAGKTVRIFGIDKTKKKLVDTQGNDGMLLTIGLPNGGIAWNPKKVSRIDRVEKPITVGFVTIFAQLSMTAPGEFIPTVDDPYQVVARYYPQETDPQYRVIKLSKSAAAIRMLYRRKTDLVRHLTDIIPLSSRHALSMAMRAVLANLNGQDGTAMETMAVKYLAEEQQARNSMALSEDITPTNTSINNRDTIVVADLYDDATKIFGMVGRERLFDKMTEAIEALANKSQWDGMVGYVDILTDASYYVTLPRYVETPLAINIGGSPAWPRNQFFEFHLNGPGSSCSSSCHTWDYMGEVVTFRDPPASHQLLAIPDLSADSAKKIRVYGHDEFGKPIRTIGVDGKWEDGTSVNINSQPFPYPSQPFVRRITRIVKDSTIGFVSLYSFVPETATTPAVLYKVGYFYPDETEPSYVRLKLPQKCAWIRMRYRKRTMKITGMHDPIHLRSKQAVLNMMRSIAAQDIGKLDIAEPYEQKALQQLAEEQTSRNPVETFTFQFDRSIHASDPMQGIR